MRRVFAIREKKWCQQVVLVVVCLWLSIGAAGHCWASDHVVYEGTQGAGKGKHLVFLSGDEEYRSEEGLVQIAKILAFRHGFRTTVLFAIDPKDGTINPNVNDTLPDAESLDSADAMILGLRFRHYPDEVMHHFQADRLTDESLKFIETHKDKPFIL